ncbi:MAG TPA: CHAD domain-containing protein [Synergistaceae bacterium]|nr:CHAD domain-containing protein [Synergistaceae bacterium]HPQ36443.1 CHAD domain-containing protein [Synergistaceae bacterium]
MSKTENLPALSGEGSVCLFGAEELLVRLRGFFSEIPGVFSSEDPENLHRMRVASRRIRSALPLMEKCVSSEEYRSWRKGTRRFTRALGDARDLDVQQLFLRDLLERRVLPPEGVPGIRRLLLRLAQKRRALQKKVERVLQREAREQLLHHMERTLRQLVVHLRLRGEEQDSRNLRDRARSMLVLRLEELLALEYVLGSPDFFEGHHDLRIAVKRLRYTAELFRPLLEEERGKNCIKNLKELQTLLGNLHDLDVWKEMLPLFLEDERERTLEYYGHLRCFPQLEKGLTLLEEHVSGRREALFEEAGKLWKKLEENAFWKELYLVFEELPSQEEIGVREAPSFPEREEKKEESEEV